MMKRTRVQRSRSTTRKRTRKHRSSSKQKGGVLPGENCPARCPYGDGTHAMGKRIKSDILADGTGGYFRKFTSFCSKCNCAKVEPYPVFPVGTNSRGRPIFSSD